MKSGILAMVLTFSAMLPAITQKEANFKTWNPATDSIQMSRHTAGLSLRFRTNASELTIRYIVQGGLQMPHMPATGVSGVDLYSKTIDGQWLWCAGRYTFGDTVTYRFVNLPSKDRHVTNREYTLYLLLYNAVKWMEIGMPSECESMRLCSPTGCIPMKRDMIAWGDL